MRFPKTMLIALTAVALSVGCTGDLAKQIATNTPLRDQVMGAIAGNPEVAMQAVDRFLGDENLRGQLIDRVMANPEMVQGVIQKLATSSDLVDQVVGAAVKDPAMKDHLVTLLKGMTMAEQSAAAPVTPAGQ